MSEAPQGSEIGRQVARNVGWLGIGQVGTQLLQIVSGVVLARLMTPEEFGLVGMVVVFANYANVLMNFGFGTALVQQKEITEDELSTVFWLNTGVGVGMALLFSALAPVLAWFYDTPEVEAIAIVMSTNFVVLSLGYVQRRLLERDLQFQSLSKLEMVGGFVGAVTSIAAGLAGARSWSLVVGALSRALVVTAGVWWLNRWLPSRRFSVPALRAMWGFASNVFAAETIEYLGANVDRILVGRFLGAHALGLYDQASRLMLLPVVNTSMVISRVFFPAFARIQDDPDQIASLYLRGARVAFFVTSPVLLGLAVVGRPFVALVYGPDWGDLAPLLAVFGWLGLASTVIALQSSVFHGRGMAGLAFRLSVVRRVISLGAASVALPFGLMAVAWLRLVAGWAGLVITQQGISSAIPVSLGAQVRNLAPVLSCATAMYVVVWAVDTWLLENQSPAVALAVDIPLGAAVYLGIASLVREEAWVLVLGEVRTRLARRRQRRA
ncbi:MAG: lipopolysaccharide biosynthesis protein [Alphaproteobacteria bacterium]|nr:lipopolysaccharide biosynthesis protein [Alphaproteobacteria bacterium]MCB9695768.1 lipopolysaccharide biosynthesis protein [Alphaproteobacteria bacterium]